MVNFWKCNYYGMREWYIETIKYKTELNLQNKQSEKMLLWKISLFFKLKYFNSKVQTKMSSEVHFFAMLQ